MFKTIRLGGVAQLVERLVCNQKVVGSNPVASTKPLGGSGSEKRTIEQSRAADISGPASSRALLCKTIFDNQVWKRISASFIHEPLRIGPIKNWSSYKGYTVDAWASIADERRGQLR